MQLFSKTKKTIGVDLGSSSLVLAELEVNSSGSHLLNLAHSEIAQEVFSNQLIVRPDILSETVSTLLESLSITNRDVVINLPGPSVFTKKIRMPAQPEDELRESIVLEAANYIPQDISQLQLDFHVLGSAGKNALDVLLVAVKQDVLQSYLAPFQMAGLEVAVADVDYFALQNCFELNYQDEIQKTSLLLDFGARFSAVSVVQDGKNLFCGDITLGGRTITDKLAHHLSVNTSQAETAKRSPADEGVKDFLLQQMEQTVAELARQLTFFWDASSEEHALEKIYVTGGSSLLPGFLNELSERMGIEAKQLDCFRSIELSSGEFDQKYLEELRPFSAIAIGLAQRTAGDREEYSE